MTHRVSRIIGKVENTERFLRIALYQGVAKVGAKTTARLPTNAESRGPKRDPTVVACAHGKHRLYLFTSREPEDSEQAAAGRSVAGLDSMPVAACWPWQLHPGRLHSIDIASGNCMVACTQTAGGLRALSRLQLAAR